MSSAGSFGNVSVLLESLLIACLLSPEHQEWKEKLAFLLYCFPFEKCVYSFSVSRLFFFPFTNKWRESLFALDDIVVLFGIPHKYLRFGSGLLLVPSFHIAQTVCMCPHVSELNYFKTIFSGKIAVRNKYFNTWNGAKPWVAEVNSSLFFKSALKLFFRYHNFLPFVSNLVYQNNNNNNETKQKSVLIAEW